MTTPPPTERASTADEPEKRPRRITRGVSWAIALAIVVLGIAAFMATSSSTSTPTAADGSDPAANPLLANPSQLVGRQFPDAAFERLDGTPASLADYRGKPLVVNFWQVDCAPCRTEMPDLEKLHQRYGDQVAFLGLNSGDSLDKARDNSPSFGVTYDVVVDPDQNIIRSIGGTGLPTTVLVKGDGTVARVSGPGAVDPDKLERWINEDLLS
jgi:cytochrome c biogenesis protein CcmG, thiol:disulfide interchange protein DsbE